MKIFILKGCAGVNYKYGKGGTYDAPEEIANDLINAGFAKKVKATRGTKKIETATAKSPKIEKR
jgi:hypothetical protein